MQGSQGRGRPVAGGYIFNNTYMLLGRVSEYVVSSVLI